MNNTKLEAILGCGGSGKLLTNDTLVLTPNGFIKNKDLVLGEAVICEDGTPTKILNIWEGKNLNIYRVSFHDDTYIDACEDHLWKVQTPKMRQSNSTYKVLDTKTLLKDFKHKNSVRGYKYSIPLCAPVNFKKQVLPLHPYLLGYLLGNGCLHDQVKVSCHQNDVLEIKNKFDKLLPSCINSVICKTPIGTLSAGFRLSAKIKDILEDLGLLFTYSNNKFIPYNYLHSCIEDRLEILKGLMDSDGSISLKKSGVRSISFSTTSLQLLKDVSFLVRSLGGISKETTNNRKEKGIEYSSFIRIDKNIFSLQRKAKLFNESKQGHLLNKKIIDIKYLGKQDGRCIHVDNKLHTYVVENFVVTHNSYYINSLIKEDNFYALRTATTGIAALNLGTVRGADEPTTINSALRYFNAESLLRNFHQGKTIFPLKMIDKKYKNIIIDECFVYSQKVLTTDGWQKIGLIYSKISKGQKVFVYSKNIKNRLEVKEVIAAQKKPLLNNLLEVDASSTNSNRGKRIIKGTLNHKIYTPSGKKALGDLKIGDEIIVNSKDFNKDQKSILIGTLLGDGCLNYSKKRSTPTIRFTQGYKQLEYLKYKHNCFSDLASKITISKSGFTDNLVYNFCVKTTPFNFELKDIYNNKNLSQNFINLINPLALAIWYLDNGSLAKKENKLTLHTERYSEETNIKLKEYLNKTFNLNFIVSKSKGYFYLRLVKKDIPLFFNIINPYVPECIKEKLGTFYTNNFISVNTKTEDFSVAKIKSIKEYSIPKQKQINKNYTDFVYDLTVENNHNYIAGNILVSNCSMMDSGTLDLIVLALDQYNNTFNKQLNLLISGDIGQLAPVNGSPIFTAKCWPRFNIKYLTEVKRQENKEFVEALNLIRKGKAEEALPWFKDNIEFRPSINLNHRGITLFSTNNEVDIHNRKCLDRLLGESKSYYAKSEGVAHPTWKDIPKRLEVKPGCIIQLLYNSLEQGFANGDAAIVNEVWDNAIHISLLRKKKEIFLRPRKLENFEFDSNGHAKKTPVGTLTVIHAKLMFSATNHKIQGLTLDDVQINLKGEGRNFLSRQSGMLYTSLSRVRTPEGLTIVGTPEDLVKCCYVNPNYLKWIK